MGGQIRIGAAVLTWKKKNQADVLNDIRLRRHNQRFIAKHNTYLRMAVESQRSFGV